MFINLFKATERRSRLNTELVNGLTFDRGRRLHYNATFPNGNYIISAPFMKPF